MDLEAQPVQSGLRLVLCEDRMGKLKALPPQLGALPPRITTHADAQGHSAVSEPWRAWYKLKRWADLRWSVLRRDRFTCQWPDCGRVAQSRELVADHKTPHRGDPALFWDEHNLQTLCKACHDRHKQRAERRAGWG